MQDRIRKVSSAGDFFGNGVLLGLPDHPEGSDGMLEVLPEVPAARARPPRH